MAYDYPQATSGGQPNTGFKSYLYPDDPIATRIPNKNIPQQIGQMGQLAQTLYRLHNGYQAGSIEPERQAEYRNLQQQIIPELANRYGGGNLTTSAFQQGIANAQGDVQTKLAALQSQRQFEMDKLRQEQLPNLYAQGQQAPFEYHISNKGFNPKSAPDTLATEQAAKIPGAIHNKLMEPLPNEQELLKSNPGFAKRLKQEEAKVAKNPNYKPKISAKDVPQPILQRLQGLYQRGYNALNPEAAGKAGPGNPPAIPTQGEQAQFELNQLGEKLGVPEQFRRNLRPEHKPMLDYIEGRVGASAALRNITSIDDIVKIYNFAVTHPALRTRLFEGLKAAGRGVLGLQTILRKATGVDVLAPTEQPKPILAEG